MIPLSPYDFFSNCFQKAKDLSLPQYDSMVLITATRDAKPSGRIVLLKGVVPDRGFRFFTNHKSRKASELLSNPKAQLLFYWPVLGRQIRVEGKIESIPKTDSDGYWNTRPRGSQIGAIASQQSQPLGSIEEMSTVVAALTKKWESQEIPRPENWGGFELVADYFEFWEDRESRLHERITYTLSFGRWVTGRLWP